MRKGFSLIAALIVLVIVTITVAALGMFFIGSLKVDTKLKIYKTTKEAAESVAYYIIENISSLKCSISNSSCPGGFECNLSTEMEKSLTASHIDVKVCSLKQISTPSGTTIYIFQINATKADGAGTTIIFGYEK